MTPEELYGQDILLDEASQAAIAANGEAVVSGGIQTVLQDIKLRLFTPYGSLFYDTEFGSKILDYIFDENTAFNRSALVAEVRNTITRDPRVDLNSVSANVLAWDSRGITIQADFKLVNESNPYNLIIQVNSDLDMVIKDVNPN